MSPGLTPASLTWLSKPVRTGVFGMFYASRTSSSARALSPPWSPMWRRNRPSAERAPLPHSSCSSSAFAAHHFVPGALPTVAPLQFPSERVRRADLRGRHPARVASAVLRCGLVGHHHVGPGAASLQHQHAVSEQDLRLHAADEAQSVTGGL